MVKTFVVTVEMRKEDWGQGTDLAAYIHALIKNDSYLDVLVIKEEPTSLTLIPPLGAL